MQWLHRLVGRGLRKAAEISLGRSRRPWRDPKSFPIVKEIQAALLYGNPETSGEKGKTHLCSSHQHHHWKDLSVFEFSSTSESATKVAMLAPEALQPQRVGGNEVGEEKVETARIPQHWGCVLLPRLSFELPRPKMARSSQYRDKFRKAIGVPLQSRDQRDKGTGMQSPKRRGGSVSTIPESGIPRLHPPVRKLTVEGVGLHPLEQLPPALWKWEGKG